MISVINCGVTPVSNIGGSNGNNHRCTYVVHVTLVSHSTDYAREIKKTKHFEEDVATTRPV